MRKEALLFLLRRLTRDFEELKFVLVGNVLKGLSSRYEIFLAEYVPESIIKQSFTFRDKHGFVVDLILTAF